MRRGIKEKTRAFRIIIIIVEKRNITRGRVIRGIIYDENVLDAPAIGA